MIPWIKSFSSASLKVQAKFGLLQITFHSVNHPLTPTFSQKPFEVGERVEEDLDAGEGLLIKGIGATLPSLVQIDYPHPSTTLSAIYLFVFSAFP